MQDSEWEFSAEWLDRGPRSACTISFDLADGSFGPASAPSKMARQYAFLLMATDNSIRSVATLVNRVNMLNRLIKACSQIKSEAQLLAF